MCAFDPFCGEVVGHCTGHKALESGVLYLVQPVVVRDGDEWTTVKCGNPAKMSHFDIAHDMARSSSSMIAYCDSGSGGNESLLGLEPISPRFFAVG